MSNGAERVKKWRKETKLRIIKAMGDRCQCCGYDKCYAALDLHHINPSKKDVAFGEIIANPKKWETVIVPELRKCILICSNCHREIHQGFRILPVEFTKFNESFLDYKPQKETHDECPICKGLKPIHQLTCSYKCAVRKRGCVDWDKIDVPSLLLTHTNQQIGDMFGVSESAVRKRILKLKIKTGTQARIRT